MNRRVVAYVLAATLAATACSAKHDANGPTASPSTTDSPSATDNPSATPSASTTTPSGTPSATASAAAQQVGVSKQVAKAIATFAAKPVHWTGCGGGFQCANLTVPLDYTQPGGTTISVAVIRLPARKPASRIGSLVFNPGGPGGSGIEFARQATSLFPGEILDRFDVVSFDPRGVGKSSPVDCIDDADLDKLLAVDPTPDSASERTQLFDANRDFARGCAFRSGRLLPHLGTVDVARDMDVLRTVLGDKRLTYLGFSYGTVLGARYAQQFPTHIRAFVLDGAVDPSLGSSQITLEQAKGFEQALAAFSSACDAEHCPLSTHGKPTLQVVREVISSADAHPYSASRYPNRKAHESEAMFGVAAGLYSKEFGWPVLREAAESAYTARDGSGLLALFDSLVERDQNGHYSNSVEAQAAISCVDSDYPHDPASYDRDAASFAKQSPTFGRALAYGTVACAYWSAPPVTHPGPVSAPGAPTIVVVGTTRDPATPYRWSQALADQLRGVLLTHDGDGHTAYGYHRSSCVERVVDAYLVALTVPASGTRCP